MSVQLFLWNDLDAQVRMADHDRILLNTSAGKDSLAMVLHLVGQARAEGVLDRLVAVHADLDLIEWPGTRQLAERQVRALTGPDEPPLRFEVVRRTRNGVPEDLLGYLLRHRKWPAARTRWCTSDLKRGPVKVLITRLVNEVYAAEPGRTRPVRILNCLGLRAAESRARAKRPPLRTDANGRRQVTEWLPLHTWPTDRVWAQIKAAGAEPHPAYAAGQSRASCVFCVLNSNLEEHVRAARLNVELAQLYELAEWLIGHDFRVDLAMRDVLTAAGIAPLPRDWPLEAIFHAAPAGTGTAVAIAVLRGQLSVAQAPVGTRV